MITDYVVEYEWLINFIAFGLLTIFILIPETKNKIFDSITALVISSCYTVLLFSIFVNGIIKGF